MTFNFHQMVEQNTDLHFSSFGEDVVLTPLSGDAIPCSAIVGATVETGTDGVSQIVKAEVVVPSTIDDEPLDIRTTWTVVLRGQRLSIETILPPVAGMIKLGCKLKNSESTHRSALNGRL